MTQYYLYANVLKGINKPNAVASVSSSSPCAPPLPTFLLEKPIPKTYNGSGRYEKYLENKLAGEIEMLDDKSHHSKLNEAAGDLRKILQEFNKDIKMCVSGSFASRVDLPGSDLDVIVKLPECMQHRNDFNTLMKLKDQFNAYNQKNEKLFVNFYVSQARVPVLAMRHVQTGTSMDIVCKNQDGLRNSEFLYYYSQVDHRFSLLCKAVKCWATYHGIIDAKEGRLNSFTICLMVLHFLQDGVSPAVLPVLHKELPELFEEKEDYMESFLSMDAAEMLKSKGFQPSENKEDIGSLFLGFLKYFSKFKFDKYWISVREGKKMSRSDITQLPDTLTKITVQDPFTNRNCGCTVQNKDIYDRIRFEIRMAYKNTVKHATIFTHGHVTPRREMIKNEGCKQDTMIRRWRAELDKAGNRERLHEGYKSCGDFWDFSFLRVEKKHETTKKDTRAAWPENITYRCFMF